MQKIMVIFWGNIEAILLGLTTTSSSIYFFLKKIQVYKKLNARSSRPPLLQKDGNLLHQAD
jgi:hypothetical protein